MSSNISIPKTCQYCGSSFIAKTTVTRHCSPTCRNRAHKQRVRDEKIQNALRGQQETLQVQIPIETITSKNSLNDKTFLSVQEVSDLLGVSRWTIQRMIKRGDIIVKQFGRKKIINRIYLDNLFN